MKKLLFYFIICPLFFVSEALLGQSDINIERVILKTDRDIYIAGEQLFFACQSFNESVRKPLSCSKFAYFVLRNEKNVLISGICLKLENNTFSGSIYLPDTLSTGRYQLVAFTNYMRNFGEKSFFTKEILIANRFDKDLIRIYSYSSTKDTLPKGNLRVEPDNNKNVITLTPDKNKYNKREKIKVTLNAIGIKDNEIAHLSISVHEKTYQQENKFHRSNNLSDNKLSCIHLPEINGIILEGKVMNNDNQQVIPSTTVYLSAPDTIANLQFTKTNSVGVFRFLLNGYYNNKNLILNLPDTEKGRIVLDDKYDLKEPFKPSRQFSDSLLKDYLVKSQNILQIQKTYKLEIIKELTDKKALQDITVSFYDHVSDPVYPSNFVSLPDFIEISRELLPRLKIRKHGSNYEARIFDLPNLEFFNGDPLVFLDGVPINSISQLISLGTEKINKIETLGVERYDGGLYYSGVLAVFSKKMEITNIAWQTPMLNVKYVQLHPSSTMVSSIFSKTDKAPDFRQLLYWEPSVTIKANEKKYLEFTASDNKGEFEISVEGLTSQGDFINAKTTINIGSNTK